MSEREGALRALAARPQASALLSDFDGSLAEIVPDPDSARPLPGVAALLERLARSLAAVAVVSGRPVAFLAERLGAPEGVQLFGLYGQERLGLDGSLGYAVDLESSRRSVAELAERIRHAAPGATVEDKNFSVALHWRERPGDEALLRQLGEAAAAEGPFELREAKRSIELILPEAPDKGSVVRELGQGRRAVAYAGDDLGDLAAFDALDALAASGTEVLRIAVGGAEVPAELFARADLRLDGPVELRRLLEELAGRLGA